MSQAMYNGLCLKCSNILKKLPIVCRRRHAGSEVYEQTLVKPLTNYFGRRLRLMDSLLFSGGSTAKKADLDCCRPVITGRKGAVQVDGSTSSSPLTVTGGDELISCSAGVYKDVTGSACVLPTSLAIHEAQSASDTGQDTKARGRDPSSSVVASASILASLSIVCRHLSCPYSVLGSRLRAANNGTFDLSVRHFKCFTRPEYAFSKRPWNRPEEGEFSIHVDCCVDDYGAGAVAYVVRDASGDVCEHGSRCYPPDDVRSVPMFELRAIGLAAEKRREGKFTLCSDSTNALEIIEKVEKSMSNRDPVIFQWHLLDMYRFAINIVKLIQKNFDDIELVYVPRLSNNVADFSAKLALAILLDKLADCGDTGVAGSVPWKPPTGILQEKQVKKSQLVQLLYPYNGVPTPALRGGHHMASRATKLHDTK